MNRSRVQRGARVLTAAGACLLLVLAGCGKAGSSQPQSPSGGSSAADNRPVKAGGTLRVALDGEPDKLDPTLARTLVGRNVFASMCEKLYDINEKLELVPQLAASLPEVSADGKTVTIKLRTGLKFADGTVLDAAAVKTSLDRDRTLQGSARKSELGPVTDVTVVDPATVAIHLSAPFSPLTAVLADRAGMVMSPKQLAAKGADFGTAPVCIGAFKFSLRVAQDRIELVKDPNYYNADKVMLDKVIYKSIPDADTRFNNLRSGDIDVLFNVSPINIDQLKADPNVHLIKSDTLGYQGITVNVGNANGVGKEPGTLSAQFAGPFATNAAVRKAFALSIDRDALNRSVFRGVYDPACGPITPANPLSSDAAQACPKHDPAAAKKLLADAGVPTPVKVSMIIGNTPDGRRIGEALKSMTGEGGFDLQLEPTEFSASLDVTDAGKFQLYQIGWSGRVDPDGNITPFVQTKGSQNIAGYSNPDVDKWLNDARATQDKNKRKELYGKVIGKVQDDSPLIYLWRQPNLVGLSNKVSQIQMFQDGLLRLGASGFAQ